MPILMPQTEKKVHVTLGKEIFGKEYEGKRAVIVRALYGFKVCRSIMDGF